MKYIIAAAGVLLFSTSAIAQEVDMQARVDALVLKLSQCTNDGVLQYERAAVADKALLVARARIKELEDKYEPKSESSGSSTKK